MDLNMVIDKATVSDAMAGADCLCIGSDVTDKFVTIEGFGVATGTGEVWHLFTLRVPHGGGKPSGEIREHPERIYTWIGTASLESRGDAGGVNLPTAGLRNINS